MADAPRVGELARLARLGLSASERVAAEREFARVLEFVGVVEHFQTGALPPLLATITGVQHVLREDRAEPSLLADALLDAAPETERRMAKVPAVL